VFYDQHLDFSKISKFRLREGTEWNYSYYPIIFESEEKLLEVELKLNENDIYPRRYFYPSLNTIEYSKGKMMSVSENAASCVLCLPLYSEISIDELNRIVDNL